MPGCDPYPRNDRFRRHYPPQSTRDRWQKWLPPNPGVAVGNHIDRPQCAFLSLPREAQDRFEKFAHEPAINPGRAQDEMARVFFTNPGFTLGLRPSINAERSNGIGFHEALFSCRQRHNPSNMDEPANVAAAARATNSAPTTFAAYAPPARFRLCPRRVRGRIENNSGLNGEDRASTAE